MKTIACIIARTNSTRLPKKVLRNVLPNLILIEYIIENIKACKSINEIYLCTSSHSDDEVLLGIAEKYGIKGYAGSEDSVIDRMLDVANLEKADNLVRITGDNIFTDPVYLDMMVDYHIKENADYTRTEKLPLGITAEVMKVDALKRCYDMINPYESQYLMLYMFQPTQFNCLVLIPEERHQQPDKSFTVDTPADFERTLKILEDKSKFISYDELLDFVCKHEVPHLSYNNNSIVKFPAHLSVYFESYRMEMDKRISFSNIVKLKEGLYFEYKRKQTNV